MKTRSYDKDLRDEVIKLYFNQKRTIASLSKEFGISASTVSRWIITHRNLILKNGTRLY